MQPRDRDVERESPVRKTVLRYGVLLAFTAGFVNAVALLILALPVGNLTAVTTQLGMKTANPLLYEGHVLAAVLTGFFLGAALAGVLLPETPIKAGARSTAVLCLEATLLLLAAAGVEETFVRDAISATGVEVTAVQALLAAAALGMQNGLSSSFPEMSVRTTHFTGTVTDLGLIIGRSRRLGIDRWKAATLGLTLLSFLTGGAAGLLAGARFGGYALVVPAVSCIVIAGVTLLGQLRRPEPAIGVEG